MKPLKILIFVLLGLAIFVFTIPLLAPNSYQIERGISINRPQSEVFEYMRMFNNFDTWSPWSEMDPDMEVEISGVDGEVGAEYYWKGNRDVGEGRMRITQIDPNKIHIALSFIEPFESSSPTEYRLSANQSGTDVSWYMEGEMSYPWNAILLFMSMEEAIGKDFDRGLQKLKMQLEKR